MCQLFIDADPELWASQTRSFRMDGMVTSVRLEEMFWLILESIGERDELTVPQLLHRLYNESLDAVHDVGNFTSFLRVPERPTYSEQDFLFGSQEVPHQSRGPLALDNVDNCRPPGPTCKTKLVTPTF